MAKGRHFLDSSIRSMNGLPYDPSLSRVIEEAEDIATQVGDRLNSAHLLLALFTTSNQAEYLLLDRRIDEDRLLALIHSTDREPRGVMRDILRRAGQVAAGCGATEINSLHVLVAMTRARTSIAFRLLERTSEKMSTLRTRALTVLTGAVPRWLSGRARRAAPEGPTNAAPENMPGRMEYRGKAPSKSSPVTLRSTAASRASALHWSPPIISPKPRRDPVKELRAPSSKTTRRTRTEPPKAQSPAISKPPPVAVKVDALEPSAPAPEAHIPEEKEPTGLPTPLATDDVPPSPWILSKERYPWLTSLGRNLSHEAELGRLDRLVGRDQEVEQLIDILGKRRANNPCLVGEPGVGKTAVVEGLAASLVKSFRGKKLGERIIISLDVGALLVGTHLRGSFSEKLRGIKEEVRTSNGRIIVFFDELHTLVGAGSTGDGPQDAANELKSALARGDFACIGATTYDEYVRHIEPDAALRRRFVPVLVKEPSPAATIQMLEGVIPAYANHHDVEYESSAVSTAVQLSARYITDRHLPDKAIALLDLAGSRAARGGLRKVDVQGVAGLVSERVGIPVERLLSSDRERLLNLESHLERGIVGHRKQLHRIAEVIRRNAAGFTSHRPLGAFLFVGPTGVGKTETAKAIAHVLHGSEDQLVRLDLSEFSEAHAVSRLIGAPPGYVGHDTGGQLTEAVRRHPACVVLFDEIEKAHVEVLQTLLQILDDGRLTDGRGRTVSFAETIIILTSNLGSDLQNLRKPIGFDDAPDEQDDRSWLEKHILEQAEKRLPPELWGRIEERLVYTPLTRQEIREIAKLLASDSSSRLSKERGIAYELDDDAIDYLVDQGGFNLRLGARPMRHTLARIVEAPIAARILEGRLHADERVIVSKSSHGGLTFLVGEERTSLSQRPAM